VTPDEDWPPGLPPPRDIGLLKGGYICRTFAATLADGREVVVKRCPYPAAIEADGLAALAAAGVPVPAVLGAAGHALVLERVAGPPDWPFLGRALAGMHQAMGPRFGWHQDNTGGLTVQHNAWCDSWAEFYAERRVRPHLDDERVPPDLAARLHRACDGPLRELLPERPPAVLTHGDLWLGNIVDGRWIVDPAVSYADRELDLAYMQLSDSLPAGLWDAYLAELPPDPGYETRRPALQLHKFLNNIRHFGPDRYVPRIEAVLGHYGW
jgi:fructosamine-3-kinase